jgi:hypothetical protein
MKYIGVRSCNGLPEKDIKYNGSSKIIPLNISITGIKNILQIFDTRHQAVQYEANLHKKHNVKLSPLYYNQVNQTSIKFDQQGCTAKTHKHVAKMANKLKGRTATTHEYIRKANEKRKALSGNNRTSAQIAGQIKVANTIRGTKNPKKACKGIQNGGFNEWYYITPKGVYHEVKHLPKQDFADKLGVTPRQLGHRFHHTNMHKKAKTPPLKGYIFGNLPMPTNTGIT